MRLTVFAVKALATFELSKRRRCYCTATSSGLNSVLDDVPRAILKLVEDSLLWLADVLVGHDLRPLRFVTGCTGPYLALALAFRLSRCVLYLRPPLLVFISLSLLC